MLDYLLWLSLVALLVGLANAVTLKLSGASTALGPRRALALLAASIGWRSAMAAGVLIFLALKPHYEYLPGWTGYWTFYAVALALACGYVLVMGIILSRLTEVGFRQAAHTSSRLLLGNLLLTILLFFLLGPNHTRL